jgi:hypothetical protein
MNDLLNPVAILQDSLERWDNNAVFCKYVSREFDDSYAVPNEKVGYTVNARIPVRFRGRRGDAAQPEAIQEQMVPVTINTLWGQDLQISDQDLVLTIDRFGERYTESSSAIIAQMMDGDGLDQYQYVYNFVGQPGVTPASLATYTQAKIALENAACPTSDQFRSLVVNPDAQGNVLGFNFNFLLPTKEVSDQYLYGNMGKAVGWKWSMDQNVSAAVVGALGTAGAPTSNPIVNGANQSGSSLVTSGWDASQAILNPGDIISIGSGSTACIATNPLSFRSTNKLRTFVVTAPVVADNTGAATIPIEPPINFDTTSPFQTVVSAPAAGAAISVYLVGHASFSSIGGVTSPQNMGFHKQAFTLAVVKQETPGGLDWSEQVINPKLGMAMRLTRGFLIGSNERITRLEVLGGFKTIRPEWAVRIGG